MHGLAETRNDGPINPGKVQERLQGVGDLIAQKPGKPGLVVNLEQLRAVHRAYYSTFRGWTARGAAANNP